MAARARAVPIDGRRSIGAVVASEAIVADFSDDKTSALGVAQIPHHLNLPRRPVPLDTELREIGIEDPSGLVPLAGVDGIGKDVGGVADRGNTGVGIRGGELDVDAGRGIPHAIHGHVQAIDLEGLANVDGPTAESSMSGRGRKSRSCAENGKKAGELHREDQCQRKVDRWILRSWNSRSLYTIRIRGK